MDDVVRKKFEENGGVLTLKRAIEKGISRFTLDTLLKNNEIEKLGYGIYGLKDIFVDEFYLFQLQHSSVVFSHNTALYFFNKTERTPIKMDVTVSNSYNISKIKDLVNIHRALKETLDLGVIEIVSPQGQKVRCYNLERTICDIIRNPKHIDLEIRNKAIKQSIRDKNFDSNLMFEYAKKMKIYKKVESYMEAII